MTTTSIEALVERLLHDEVRQDAEAGSDLLCLEAAATIIAQVKEIERLREGVKQIADAPAWGYPDRWETTPSEVRQLARALLTKEPTP